jgi:hypothetical protein
MKSRILAHRGNWLEGLAKNSRAALSQSLTAGFGIETDVRDAQQQLLVSHDPPCGNEMRLCTLLEQAANLSAVKPVMALNIKADGLAPLLAKHLEEYPGTDSFVFDMAVPDMRDYLKHGIPVFTRISEVERVPPWFDQCSGVWLDAFEADWYGADFVRGLLRDGKRVCVVSPELHRRAHLKLWELLRPLAKEEGFLLCTDFPVAALEFFEAQTA